MFMIDWAKTKQEFGYDKDDLPKTSHNKVVWKCDNQFCDAPADIKEREYEFNYARKKAEKAATEGKIELCQRCSHSHRRGHVTEKKEKTALPLPPEVNDAATVAKFGYKASELSPWTRKPVVLLVEEGLNFEGTMQYSEHVVPRAQLNISKSVKETGHYRPIAWWTQQRRKGIKISDNTKTQMKESQKLRRQREKAQDEELYQKHIASLKGLDKKVA
jgi:hypothetical protein